MVFKNEYHIQKTLVKIVNITEIILHNNNMSTD